MNAPRMLGAPGVGGPDTAALKATARAALNLTEDDTLVLQELACAEPGCPPVETVLAVLRRGVAPQKWTFHHPLQDLTSEGIRQAVLGGGQD